MFTETEKMQLCFAGGCRFVNSLADCAGLEHEYYNLLHAYAKRTGELQEYLVRQIEDLQKTGNQLLHQMREELESQLARLQEPT